MNNNISLLFYLLSANNYSKQIIVSWGRLHGLWPPAHIGLIPLPVLADPLMCMTP